MFLSCSYRMNIQYISLIGNYEGGGGGRSGRSYFIVFM